MNSGVDLSYFFWQLSYHGPTMFVCLVAGFFAIQYWNRARTPALLALLGAAIMIVVPIFATLIQFVAMQNLRNNSGMVGSRFMLQGIGLVGSFGRGAGMALWAAAIFIGRPTAPLPEDRYLHE
jgi:hypothetical protein